MTSRAWPGNQLPWGPALLPDTNQSLLAEGGLASRSAGPSRLLPPGLPARQESLLLPTSPWLGRTGPGHSGCLAPTVSHSHTHTESHPWSQVTGPRTSEHTGTQSAHGPQGGVITVGWAPGAHRPGKAAYGPGAPSSLVPSGCWGPCDRNQHRQGGQRSQFTGETELGSERPGRLLKVTGEQGCVAASPRAPLLLKAAWPDQERRFQEQGGWATAALAPSAGLEDSGAGELGLRREAPAASEVVTEQAL